MGEALQGFFSSSNPASGILNLEKANINQRVTSSSSQLEASQSIFNQRAGILRGSEDNLSEKLISKQVSQIQYENLNLDLRNLRRQELSFDSMQNASTRNILKHEESFKKENPEAVKIEKQIGENNKKIADYQKQLHEQSYSKDFQSRIIKSNSLLQVELTGFKNLESSLKLGIESIKDQIHKIKNGSFSLQNIQKSMTGSSNTSAIDVQELIEKNLGTNAVVGEKQKAFFKEMAESINEQRNNMIAEKTKEEIETTVKEAQLVLLEKALKAKEEELAGVQSKIARKESQISQNESEVNSSKGIEDSGKSKRAEIEEKIETLMKETSELMKKRLDADPELVRFNIVTNFFNRFLKGNGSTGTGVTADIKRKETSLDTTKERLEKSTETTDDLQNIVSINRRKKNIAKADFFNKKMSAEQAKEIFNKFKVKYNIV